MSYNLGPNIDVHDPNVKLKKAQEFIDDGDKVKMVMKLRGREIPNGKMFIDQINMMVKNFQILNLIHTKTSRKQNIGCYL